MKFSVIVPIYNVANYLPKCIESVISQNYDDYELILVNDGSKDNSLEICNKYAINNSNIIVINKKNGGLTSARKAGITIAKGEYIACLDGDDYLDSHYFERLSEIVKGNPDCISFGYHTFDDKGDDILVSNPQADGVYVEDELKEIRQNIVYSKKIKQLNYGIVNPSIWSKVVKRDIYKKAQLNVDDQISFGEDLLLTTMIFKEIKNLIVISDYLYWYRVIRNSMSREYNPKVIGQLDLLAEKLIDILGNDERIPVYLYMQINSQLSKAAKVLDYAMFKRVLYSIREQHTMIYKYALYYLKDSHSLKEIVMNLLLKNKLDLLLFYILRMGRRK